MIPPCTASCLASDCACLAWMAIEVGFKEAVREASQTTVQPWIIGFCSCLTARATASHAVVGTAGVAANDAGVGTADDAIANDAANDANVAEQSEQIAAEQPLAELQSDMQHRLAVWNVRRTR